nr:hypothetical protein [Streptomyces sp. PR69]
MDPEVREVRTSGGDRAQALLELPYFREIVDGRGLPGSRGAVGRTRFLRRMRFLRHGLAGGRRLRRVRTSQRDQCDQPVDGQAGREHLIGAEARRPLADGDLQLLELQGVKAEVGHQRHPLAQV